MSVTESTITVSHLSHHYGDNQALDDVSFTVQSGGFYGLLGPNGSGKTTLFRLLATLLPVQSGQVSICGFDLQTSPAQVRQRLGVTFQSPAVDSRLTVQENLACHGRIYGISGSTLSHRMDELLGQFQLTDRRTSIVGQLSGGLRRRVELAKGLMHSPQVLLLDEPSTGLDPAARRQFWDLIQQQRQQAGTTVIVTTHLMEEAECCEQLLLLDGGKVIREGTPQQLQASLDGQRLTIRTRNNTEWRASLESLLQSECHLVGDRLSFRVTDAAAMLQQVMATFSDQIVSAEIAQPTLEDVFLEATGRRLTETVSEETQS